MTDEADGSSKRVRNGVDQTPKAADTAPRREFEYQRPNKKTSISQLFTHSGTPFALFKFLSSMMYVGHGPSNSAEGPDSMKNREQKE